MHCRSLAPSRFKLAVPSHQVADDSATTPQHCNRTIAARAELLDQHRTIDAALNSGVTIGNKFPSAPEHYDQGPRLAAQRLSRMLAQP